MVFQGLQTTAYVSMLTMFPSQRALIATVSANIWALIWLSIISISSVLISRRNEHHHKQDVARSVEMSSITLQMVLENEEAVHLLMLYLSKQYSMELLLSFIEFVQYQQWILHDLGIAALTPQSSASMQFPCNIPHSEIIEMDEITIVGDIVCESSLYSAKKKAHRLYKKFIAVGSEYEINISYVERGAVEDNRLDGNWVLCTPLYERCRIGLVHGSVCIY